MAFLLFIKVKNVVAKVTMLTVFLVTILTLLNCQRMCTNLIKKGIKEVKYDIIMLITYRNYYSPNKISYRHLNGIYIHNSEYYT